MKYFVILLLPIFSFAHFDKDSIKKRLSYEVCNLNFLDASNLYQGSNLLFSITLKFRKNRSIGISTGIFNLNSTDPYIENYKMKYTYFPLNLNYKKNYKRWFFKFEIGTNVFSFFDSNYFLKESTTSYSKTFWPDYNATNYVSNLERRKKHWVIITPSISIKIIKKLYFTAGGTFYAGNSVIFPYLNIGLTCKIK